MKSRKSVLFCGIAARIGVMLSKQKVFYLCSTRPLHGANVLKARGNWRMIVFLIHVYGHTYARMYIHIFTHICTYVRTYVYIYTYTYVLTYMYVANLIAYKITNRLAQANVTLHLR